MNLFVESLKRLYENDKVTNEKLTSLVREGKINENEKQYIIGKEGKQSCIPY